MVHNFLPKPRWQQADTRARQAQWLARPAVFLHAVGIAVWAGSLVPFALVLRGGGDAARRMLRRFSAVILPAVGMLAVAGLILAVVQVEHVEAFWRTAYGRVFLVKLGLLLMLFTLAAINRYPRRQERQQTGCEGSAQVERTIQPLQPPWQARL